MKAFWILLIAMLALSCSKDDDCQPVECADCPEDVVKPDLNDPSCALNMNHFDPTFGIQYYDPWKYVIPGDQSDLYQGYFDKVISDIGMISEDIDGITKICSWFMRNFTFVQAGGNEIGLHHVNDLFATRQYYGCHSAALVQIGILRKAGFPSVMVETAGIDWIRDYNDKSAQYFQGHVMVEVFVNGRWILLDNNGMYVDNYVPTNIYISHGVPGGLLVYAKGLDMWDYGVFSEGDTHYLMRRTAENMDCFDNYVGTVNYEWL